MSDTTIASADTAVRPFQVEVPEPEIEDLLTKALAKSKLKFPEVTADA